MNPSAHVGSIDALQALHDALATFGPEGQEALGAAEMEIRRVLDSLQVQLKNWQRQVEKRQEDVNRARADLAYKRSLNRGENRACSEQELLLRKAQDRLREAEEKVRVTRHWVMILPQHIHEYQGHARRLAGLLDTDLKRGLTTLQNKINVLLAYTAVRPSVEAPPVAPRPSPTAEDKS
jgi:hypothetical protein